MLQNKQAWMTDTRDMGESRRCYTAWKKADTYMQEDAVYVTLKDGQN